MTETFEEPESQPTDMGRYLDMIRRRHVVFLVVLFAAWALIWGSSWILPARYKSSTLILVQEPTMPKNYVVPNVNDDLQDRLESITQQIMSRTRLLLIIDKFNLYSGTAKRPATADDKVNRMRKDIDIDLVRDNHDEITAFKISYVAAKPLVAQKVAGELTNLFIDANLRVQQEQSENTTKFIQTQLDAARQSLAEQEARVRDFENRHEGELPAQQATNLQILSGLQNQIQSEQDALSAAIQQRVYYQTLIDQYRTLQPGRVAGATGPTNIASLDDDLDKMQAQLADLRSHYTDQWPDIQKLKRQIAQTEKTRAALTAELKNRPAGQKPEEEPVATGPLLQLQSQMHANQTEIANREKAIAALRARIADYQARLNAEPASEQQMADLTRGYDQSKENYDDLLKKESQSQMATSMEEMQQGERFTMLDPPSYPAKPDFPNRLKMCGAGFVMGLMLAVAVVLVLEFMDDRLHSDKEIEKLLGMVVISEIPEIQSDSDVRRGKMKIAMGWALAAFVFAMILAGSAFSYLHA